MKRVLLVGLWLLFIFLLLQAAGFVYYRLEVAKPIEGYGYPAGLFVAHPDLGYLYQPGFNGYFKGGSYHDIPIEINAQGFRDREFEVDAEHRAGIAVLGDSVVFGAGVRAEERFTECLRSTSGAAVSAPRVLNLGVNSYSFGHYLTLAQLDFLGLSPRAVLVGLTLNDFAPMADSGPARRLRRHADGSGKPPWVARIQERLGRTYAGRFLSEISLRLRYARMNADAREAYHTKWMRSVVAGWADPANRAAFEADLEQFAARMASAELPFGFVLFPELNDVLDPDQFSGPRETVLDLLAAQGLPVCDLYPQFAEHPNPASLFLDQDDIHYTPEGHRLVCEALEACLDEWGLLRP
jgi:lysophospholipase L1-like esterase